MFAALGRSILHGVQDFFRNFWLSLVTVTILVLALLAINVLVVIQLLAASAINSVKDKIDVTLYFNADATEEQVMNVKTHLESNVKVKSIAYISKDEAASRFLEKHKNDPEIVASMSELGESPFGATLVVTAYAITDYTELLALISGPEYEPLIKEKDFSDHQQKIDAITGVTEKIRKTLYVVAIVFSVISVLIIFNAIRITTYTKRDEIKAMKLVGATDLLVRLPFIVVGVLYALFALLITIALLYPFIGFIQPHLDSFFVSNAVNLLGYFNAHFFTIFGYELLVLIALVVFASYVALRRYLRV